MPAQTARTKTAYYTEGNTAPDLTDTLLDEDGNAIDLTGATVKIYIAFAMPRSSYYTSPRDRIVDGDTVTITNAVAGEVAWTPGIIEGTDKLTPPGDFLYAWEITFSNGTVQDVPANTYLPMFIKTKVGGRGA